MAICNPGIWALTLTFDPAAGCKHKHVLAEVNGLAVTSLRCSQCHFISACKCTWVEFVGMLKRFQRLSFFTLIFYVCVLMTFSLAGTRGSGTICQIFILSLYHIYIIWGDFPIRLGGFFPSQLWSLVQTPPPPPPHPPIVVLKSNLFSQRACFKLNLFPPSTRLNDVRAT